MQVSDKLIKPLTEAKYLNADNVSRYRCIMRIFFEHYEKLKYWLYQEEVYEEMIQDPLFADYRPEQCQQDLTMLTEWKNLNTIQDTKKGRIHRRIQEQKVPVSDDRVQCGDRASGNPVRESVHRGSIIRTNTSGAHKEKCRAFSRHGRKR